MGDADFFLLDNRTHRSPNRRKTGERTQLGEEQLQWLVDNLAASYATFKFVVIGGQVLSTSPTYESYSNYGFDDERQRIIDYIYAENIKMSLSLVEMCTSLKFRCCRKMEGRPFGISQHHL